MQKLEFPDPFMHDHAPVRELSDIDPGPSSKGEKFADWVYENLGSWQFILIQSILVTVWVLLNATAYLHLYELDLLIAICLLCLFDPNESKSPGSAQSSQ